MHEQATPPLPPLPKGCSLSPEFRLAVACSWIPPGPLEPLQVERVRALCDAGIDWDKFLAMVDRQGITVQALTILRRYGGEGIPERLLRKLGERRRKSAVRATVQMAELIRVNRLLCREGIEAVPLKGACLSHMLYGSHDIRASMDMDILIRPETLPAADRVLTGSGYRRLYNLTDRQTAAFMACSHHMNYLREESGQHLELHWRSHFWSRDEMEDLWRGRRTVVIMGEPFSCIDETLLFLFLSDHGSRHSWFRMKWLSDIAMMIASGKISDWDAIIAHGERLGLRRILAQTALLVHWLYGLPLPGQFQELVAGEKSAVGLAKKGVSALIKPAPRGNRMEGLRNTAYYKRIRPELSTYLLLKEMFMSTEDYISFPLPDRLFWMYLPLRPFFWFWRHYGNKSFSGGNK